MYPEMNDPENPYFPFRDNYWEDEEWEEWDDDVYYDSDGYYLYWN